MQISEFQINQIDTTKKSYLFGPFVGELGWELFRWCGFVRWFKESYPDKEVIVGTRIGREDLYTKVADKFYKFQIYGDYIQLRPNMYRIDGQFAELETEKLKNTFQSLFPDSHLISPPLHTHNRFFYQNNQSFKFETNNECASIISKLLNKMNKKIPIVVCPRHRKDMNGTKLTRNWPTEYWTQLFNLLDHDGRFVTFIAGDKCSTFMPTFDTKKSSILALNITANASLIGLTIEAIKRSYCTIGQQSALPILSNFLNTPTIMWGNEKFRHQRLENPINTPCKFHERSDFQVSPVVIYNSLKEMVEKHGI